jgi:hypothetical protein
MRRERCSNGEPKEGLADMYRLRLDVLLRLRPRLESESGRFVKSVCLEVTDGLGSTFAAMGKLDE